MFQEKEKHIYLFILVVILILILLNKSCYLETKISCFLFYNILNINKKLTCLLSEIKNKIFSFGEIKTKNNYQISLISQVEI